MAIQDEPGAARRTAPARAPDPRRLARSDTSALAPPVERIEATAYRIPTEAPESDGTFEWSATTLVVVQVFAAGRSGIGYTYAPRAAEVVVHELLAPVVLGLEAGAIPRAWDAMRRAVRNAGGSGIASTAIAAVDAALWDLKARLLGVSMIDLLGACRERIPVYGSGGFTSYTIPALERQLSDWIAQGFGAVKIKVGRDPAEDARRIRAARRAIGEATLMIDANGAYDRKQALDVARIAAGEGVSWFEEPVPADDLEGLRLVRDRAPAGLEIAAGEYGWAPIGFRRLLEAGAVDVLQADATRCRGPTGFLHAAALCEAHGLPLSTHTAPALHAPLACAVAPARHVEWFHDHVRIERMLFEGALEPVAGMLDPDSARPGWGIELRARDAERFRP